MPSPPRLTQARLALGVFAVTAVAITVLDTLRLLDHLFWLKGVPVWALSLSVALRLGLPGNRLVVGGLLLGSVGDISLGLTQAHPPEIPFLVGLSAFLLGHVCYILAFRKDFQPRPARLAVMAAVVLAGVAMGAVLVPRLGPTSVPVLAYLAVISAMVIAALGRRSPSWELPLGALVFLLSDAMIAVNVFVKPIPRAELWVFSTYFLAQFLIADGWTRDRTRPAPG